MQGCRTSVDVSSLSTEFSYQCERSRCFIRLLVALHIYYVSCIIDTNHKISVFSPKNPSKSYPSATSQARHRHLKTGCVPGWLAICLVYDFPTPTSSDWLSWLARQPEAIESRWLIADRLPRSSATDGHLLNTTCPVTIKSRPNRFLPRPEQGAGPEKLRSTTDSSRNLLDSAKEVQLVYNIIFPA